MIKKELYSTRDDGIKLYRTYSDEHFKIKQLETGNIYAEAIDIEASTYTYEETSEQIESEDATIEDYKEALAELGVRE